MELGFLCQLAESLLNTEHVKVNSLCITNFATLLLAMIRAYTLSRKVNLQEEWLLNVLQVYKAIIPRMNDVHHHIPFVSRLFGPSLSSASLFNCYPIRSLLLEV
jgi:hypothetical protein